MKKNKETTKESFSVIVLAVLLALCFRVFLFEPFGIPSGSMKPNFLVGDYIFISKYSYGYSRYSIPFGPKIFSGRILDFNKPERGDVVVFMLPTDDSIYYIKRLIGLPGDRVQVIDGIVHLNDKALPNEKIGEFTDTDGSVLDEYIETLPSGKSYKVLDYSPHSIYDNTKEFIVPEGRYFFMGDNRDVSLDSRAHVGFVKFENFVGKAEIVLFSTPEPFWKPWAWLKEMNLKRFLVLVD